MTFSSNLINIILLNLIFSSSATFSQNTPFFTQFYLQDYYFNPSLFGNEENDWNFNLIHRQWSNSNFNGGLNTQNLGIDKSFGSDDFKFGLGGQIIRDNQGLAFENISYGGGISFSFGKEHSFGFGLATYYNQNIFNPSGFQNMEAGDMLIEAGKLNNVSINPSFGLNYKFDNSRKFSFQFGASFKNLYDFKNQPRIMDLKHNLFDQFNGLMNIRIGKIKNFNARLMSIYRAYGGFGTNYLGWSNNLLPDNWNNTLLFNFPGKAQFSFGASYNSYISENNQILSASISPLFMLNIDKFNVGIAYDYSLTNLQQYSKGTFEVSLSGTLNARVDPSRDMDEDNEEVESRKKKSKTKVKDLGVSSLNIKTGDDQTDFKEVNFNENFTNDNFFKLSGSAWNNGIQGFKLRLNFFNIKKTPSKICFDLIEIEIRNGVSYVVGTIFRKKEFILDKNDTNSQFNWVTIKLGKSKGMKRYILKIYDCKNPQSKAEFKFYKQWL